MVTNAQKLQNTVDLNYQIDSSALEGALMDHGNLNPEDAYIPSNKEHIDLAAADLIFALCSSSDVKEGQMTLTVANKNVMWSKRKAILNQYGLGDTDGDKKPTLSSPKVW